MKFVVFVTVFFQLTIANAVMKVPNEAKRFSFNVRALEMEIAVDKITSASTILGVSLRVPVRMTTFNDDNSVESKLFFYIQETGKTLDEAKRLLKDRIQGNLAIYLDAKCSHETLTVYVYPSNLFLDYERMGKRSLESPLGRVVSFTNSECRQSSEQKAAEMVSTL